MKESLRDKVYNKIFQDIVQGVYKQNDILNEKKLIEEFGVSKSPVREALMQLCNEGVLISHPRYGYEVVRIDEREIYDIIRFRIILETANLRDIFPKLTKKDIDEIERYTIEECCDDSQDLTTFQHWDLNGKFHLKLMSYGDNAYATKEIARCIHTMSRAYAQKYWERLGRILIKMGCDGHLSVVKRLREGNLEEAVNLLSKDISSFYELFYSVIGNYLGEVREEPLDQVSAS